MSSLLRLIALVLLLRGASGEKRTEKPQLLKTLGIKPDHTVKELKKAFHARALELHPDKQDKKPERLDRAAAESQFHDVVHAYETLMDDGFRKVKKVDQIHRFSKGDEIRAHVAYLFNWWRDFVSAGFYFAWGQFSGYGSGDQEDGEEELFVEKPGGALRRNLTRKEFPQVMGGGGKPSKHLWLVEFWVPGCPDCKAWVKPMETVAEEFRESVVVGSVNCAEEGKLCAAVGVKHYPSIIMVVGNSQTLFSGSLTGRGDVSSLRDFTTQQLPLDLVTVVSNRDDLHTYLSAPAGPCGGGGGGGNRQKAKWGVCGVFFPPSFAYSSEMERLRPILASAAYRFQDKMPMAEVSGRRGGWHRSTCDTLSASLEKIPHGDEQQQQQQRQRGGGGGGGGGVTFAIICDGDVRTAVRYTGAWEVAPLDTFIASFKDGKRCRGLQSRRKKEHKERMAELNHLYAAGSIPSLSTEELRVLMDGLAWGTRAAAAAVGDTAAEVQKEKDLKYYTHAELVSALTAIAEGPERRAAT